MNIDLTGRQAVVTGSTAGIGRATAEGLARAGAAVVVNGRTTERVEQAVNEMRLALPEARVTGVAADLATAEGAEALLRTRPRPTSSSTTSGPRTCATTAASKASPRSPMMIGSASSTST